MPIANEVYARYYQKNRDKLLGQMKQRYDSDKKHAYYEANKEAIKQQNAERYRVKKAANNQARFEKLRGTLTDEKKIAMVEEFLTTDKYKTANSWVFEYLEN